MLQFRATAREAGALVTGLEGPRKIVATTGALASRVGF